METAMTGRQSECERFVRIVSMQCFETDSVTDQQADYVRRIIHGRNHAASAMRGSDATPRCPMFGHGNT